MHGNSVLPLTPVTIGLLSYYTDGAEAVPETHGGIDRFAGQGTVPALEQGRTNLSWEKFEHRNLNISTFYRFVFHYQCHRSATGFHEPYKQL